MGQEDLSKLKIDKTELDLRARKSKRLLWVSVAALLIVALGAAYALGWFTPAHEVELASVSMVFPSQTFTQLNASGYVVAQRKAAVASKVTGRLVDLTVEEGNQVKAGEVIARLENADTMASRDQARANVKVAEFNVEQARAELEDATLHLNRIKGLIRQGFASRQELDVASARYRKAVAAVDAAEASERASRAALKAAEVALDYTYIRAPFDAVVLTKNADIGDIVTPIGAAADAKAAVVNIADMASLQVEVDVSESNLGSVKVGQPCEIQLDALGEARFPGTVHMIVPTADRSKATVLVKVRFDELDPRILPEMSAKVAFLSRKVEPAEATPRLAIRPSAVVEGSGGKVVFLEKEGRVAETPVSLGEPLGEMVEVVSGVKAGDRVVANPSSRLKDNDRIKIAKE
ncbi:MAG: efflux RND transporter periplasmic adaptor subunit [bacterium]|nr:efflux RND transporter periplasmic adaptor subunit [bacterium]